LVKNSSTNTVFDNPGIDIAAKNGSPAYAAAPGTVSLVHWLPGYGSLVIVNHGKGIRTVYANLSSVNVKKGQAVNTGTQVGKSGESVDGEFLHFEVWSGSTRHDPTKYLK
jgi:murein DD-endopeptidase MepM/ murein hydrolase activator NlpD